MSGLSSKALAFGSPENKLKYNGKEEQRNEFSDGSGMEWMDYGARMYDAQVGRWGVIDLLSEKYISYSPFTYCINNTVNYIDFDGNEIGNPNSPDTKRIQEVMSKSSVSKILWEKMADDKTQKIHFYIESSKSTSKFTKTMGTAGAETTTLNDYNYRSKNGKHNPNTEKVAFEFDQESGNNYKSSEWDNAAIVVNDENRISVVSKLGKAGISTDGYSIEETNEIVYLYLLTHEATHTTLQSTYNNRDVKKGPDGKYVQTSSVIPHDQREEEIDADKMALSAAQEYDANRKRN
ncbi:MAG: hypothetical protein J0M10_11215 [Chitinophagales bacterium]|nr:hypothetical protein [Chitinophagales bacterium]